MKNYFLFFTLFLLISGCRTVPDYKEKLISLQGSNADIIVSSWGAPDRVTELSNGNYVIEYFRRRNIKQGGNTYYVPQNTRHTNIYGFPTGSSRTSTPVTRPVYYKEKWCKTVFTVDKNNIIVSSSFEGNDCNEKYLPKLSSHHEITKQNKDVFQGNRNKEDSNFESEFFEDNIDLSNMNSPFKRDQFSIAEKYISFSSPVEMVSPNKIKLFSEANFASEIVGYLNKDVPVPVIGGYYMAKEPEPKWIKIRLSSKVEGFVWYKKLEFIK